MCVSAINVCTCMRVSFGSRFRCTFHSSSSAFNYLQEGARLRESERGGRRRRERERQLLLLQGI